MEGYVGLWKGKTIQRPEQFQRTRIIGEHTVKLPKPPKKEEIDGYDLPRKDQRFRPGVISLNYDDLDKDERISISVNEWGKRKEGFWFYNNGTIEYVTGTHYFYLSYWKIDIGLPQFRDSDRDLHYLWNHVENDVNCFGLIYFTNRRSGKTVIGTNIIYEYASRKDWIEEYQTENSECGIQSKTKPDGQKIFLKLISSWKKLNSVWKPTDSGDTNPKNELRFEAPSKRSSKGVKKIYDKVLNSIISFKSSIEDAYDGFKLKRYYFDEFGKGNEVNSSIRWDVVKPCLVVGTTIVGKAYGTTTVEEMENKGGKAAKELYDGADINKRKADGRTANGLYRLFKPAFYGFEGYISEYGYSNIKGAKTALLNQRDGLEGDKLAGEVRKYPFTIKEAFFATSGSQTFSAQKIFEQKDYNESLQVSPIRKGNFIMTDEETQKVEFFEDINGFFQVSWMPEKDLRSKFTIDARGFMNPSNTNSGVIGVDPFDHKSTVGLKKSDAAASYFRRFSSIDQLKSNCFVSHYLGRRPDPELFYRDMINMAIFFGVQLLVENQKPGLINFLNREGYQNYIFTTRHSDYTKNGTKKRIEGVSMAGTLVREQCVNNMATYIYKFIGKTSLDIQKKYMGRSDLDLDDNLYGNCPFPDMLEDWLSFEADNWTDYDSTVSSMIALLGVTPVRKKAKPKVDVDEGKKMSFFPSFNL